MRWALVVVGVLLCGLGMVWVLQGIGALGGSFMTGDRFWAQVGFLVWLLGLGALYFSRRGVG